MASRHGHCLDQTLLGGYRFTSLDRQGALDKTQAWLLFDGAANQKRRGEPHLM